MIVVAKIQPNVSLCLFLLLSNFLLFSSFAASQSTFEDQVQEMYISYYGRPGDPEGISFWSVELANANGSLSAIIDAFGSSEEYRNRFVGLGISELIDNIYIQLFGREADAGGLNFYRTEFEAGRMTLPTIALNIADGVRGVNQDALTVTNRMAFANAYTLAVESGQFDYGPDQIEDAKALVASVDEQNESLERALEILGRLPLVAESIGEVTLRSNQYGDYYQYIPASYTLVSNVVVIVHGSPDSNESALDTASVFINRWTDLAEEKSTILVAPAFDQRNFASKTGGYGGYRSLFGREIGADEFLHMIVDGLVESLPFFDGRFYLYGHSAGGQFVNRYAIRHPERILSAVVSAAGRYAYPDTNAAWPYGMGRLQATTEWVDTGETEQIDVIPEALGWLLAAQLPITVVVGDMDLEPQPSKPGQIGVTRIEIGQSWVSEMNSHATANGFVGTVKFVLVPGIGHSSLSLTPVSQEELFSSAITEGPLPPDPDSEVDTGGIIEAEVTSVNGNRIDFELDIFVVDKNGQIVHGLNSSNFEIPNFTSNSSGNSYEFGQTCFVPSRSRDSGPVITPKIN